MLLISLFFLFVYLFGAYAYGAASLLSIRQVTPVWGGPHRNYSPAMSSRIDQASMALFVVSAVWFVLHALIEFRNLTGNTERSVLDLATFIVFLFPPLIMHTVYLEAKGEGHKPAPIYGALLALMYFVSPLLLVYTFAAVQQLVPRPEPFSPWIGIMIGVLFILASSYASALMLRLRRRERSSNQLRLRNVMIFLF